MGILRNIRKKITAIFSAIMIGSAPMAKRAGLIAVMGAATATQLGGCGAYENTEDLGNKLIEDLKEAENNFNSKKSSSDVVTELGELKGLDIQGLDSDRLIEALREMVNSGDNIRAVITR